MTPLFPKHHKLWKHASSSVFTPKTPVITEKIIEDTVFSAYIEASQILSDCNLSILNSFEIMISFDDVNRLAYQKLARSREKMSDTQSFQWSNDSQNSDKDNDDDENEDDKSNQSYVQPPDNGDTNSENSLTDIDESDSSIIPNVTSSMIRGIRIFDFIDINRSESFFRVRINNQEKFMHKQSATWLFSNEKVKLSSDRLKRVQSQK